MKDQGPLGRPPGVRQYPAAPPAGRALKLMLLYMLTAGMSSHQRSAA
jgi:hypothetical protein